MYGENQPIAIVPKDQCVRACPTCLFSLRQNYPSTDEHFVPYSYPLLLFATLHPYIDFSTEGVYVTTIVRAQCPGRRYIYYIIKEYFYSTIVHLPRKIGISSAGKE